ncbi:type II toxin-antitoxin system HicB family antitoxin [Pseudohongiella nitratireducens]|jgi:predicted RNase H-like HicB family nuclease|nr:type II toxin-antitoxin system HicB family antitoxin [Pseudohongiella nitratireducens]
MLFTVIVHHDADSDYGVTVPDLAGCFSAGSTVEEALQNTKEAIECHLEGLLLDGEELPKISRLPEALEQDDRSARLAVIDVDIDGLSNDKERVNISLPRIALRAIDRAAGRAGKTRSAYIVDASLSASRTQ